MTTDANTFCEVIKAINIVTDSSHINMTHRIIALMLNIMCVQHILIRSTHILQLVIISISQLP